MAWSVINDAQSPNWSIISNTPITGNSAFQADAFQTDAFQIFFVGTWALVDDTQLPNWGAVANLQSSGWSQISTPPAITWTQI